jgi:hypothetical protein
MTLFREEPSEHLDSQFTIACHDELVEGAKEVLRKVAPVVMTLISASTGGYLEPISRSSPTCSQ